MTVNLTAAQKMGTHYVDHKQKKYIKWVVDDNDSIKMYRIISVECTMHSSNVPQLKWREHLRTKYKLRLKIESL